MSRCPLSISPSMPWITRLMRPKGQAGGRDRFCARGSDKLLAARHEDLTVDAKSSFSRFDDLHEGYMGRTRRQLHRVENDVGHALYHGRLLLKREHTGRDLKLYQRRTEAR